jgi:hypothetical protein
MTLTENVVASSACHRPVIAAPVVVNPKEAVDLMPEVVAIWSVFLPFSAVLADQIGLWVDRSGQECSGENFSFGDDLGSALIEETQLMAYTTYPYIQIAEYSDQGLTLRILGRRVS